MEETLQTNQPAEEAATTPQTQPEETAAGAEEQNARQLADNEPENTAEPDGEGTTPPPAEPQEPETEPAPVTIPVRYNHEDRELTLEEATRYAQLGLQQDAQLQRLNRLAADNAKTLQQLIGDLEQSYREQVYAGLLEECGGNEAVARRLLDAEMKEKDAAYATRQQEAAKSAEDAKAARQEKLAGELQELMDEFPERVKAARDVPQSVYADAQKNGRSLLDAYLRYDRAEAKKVNAAKAAAASAAESTAGSQRDTAPAQSPNPFMDALARGMKAGLRGK